MKVGIVGDAERVLAWEQHLRPHQLVRQVDLVRFVKDVGHVDACFILDDSPNNLDILLSGIRLGLHCFLVSKPPVEQDKLRAIARAADEAGVYAQLSHWPTLAPSTQWMMNQLPKPSLITIHKEIAHNQLVQPALEFEHLWLDELGICLKWIRSEVHHVEARQTLLDDLLPIGFSITLRFDNGALASIQLYSGAAQSHHKRIAQSSSIVLECDVIKQTVRKGTLQNNAHLFFDKEKFNPAKAAEKAALAFLKSVQMKREPSYSAYDALQLATVSERIKKRLVTFR
ncbi:MAG: hypothetical protein AAFW89_12375 [Bacteroidota bacterium]